MTSTMNVIDTFGSWGEDELRESWAEDVKASNLILSLDEDFRFAMGVFWHKSRKDFVMWTAEELSRRIGIRPRDTTALMAAMGRKKLVMAKVTATEPLQRIYWLTDLGRDISRAALQREGVIEPYMTHTHFKQARVALGVTHADLADMLKMDVHAIMNYETGRMAVPFNVAEKVKTKLRRANALTSG